MEDPASSLIKMIGEAVKTQNQEHHLESNLKSDVKENIESVKELFKKRALVYGEYQKELYALEFKYSKLYGPLYQQLSAIVTKGKVEKFEKSEDMARQNVTGNAVQGASFSANGTGIPGFWSKVMRTAPLLHNYLTNTDLEIFEFLEGIRYSYSKKLSSPGFRLVFTFKPNPFFNNSILTKQFSWKFIDQSEDLNEYQPLKLISTKSSIVDWASKREPTDDTAAPPNGSFFKIFRDIQPDSSSSPDYAELMEDYDICVYIRDRVLPFAVYFYTGEVLHS